MLEVLLLKFFTQFAFSHENTIETSLMSKGCCLAKFGKVDFMGETGFFSWFFFNISKISTKLKDQLNTSHDLADLLKVKPSTLVTLLVLSY